MLRVYQYFPQVARVGQILPGVDRLHDRGRDHIAHPHVDLVIEFCDGQLARGFDLRSGSEFPVAGVAVQAQIRFRQQVVGCDFACRGRRMAHEAIDFLCQVNAVRKLGLCRQGERKQDGGKPPCPDYGL